jgi:biotin carboxylase
VVKPLSLSASRGVIRADDPAALRHACRRSAAIVAAAQLADEYAHTHLLVEAFVSGPEVAVEGLLCGGELRVLAIFDKPDPLEGPFFEETYYITPSRHAAAQQAQVIDTVAAACRGLGLREGPVHAEVRLSAAGCVVIELASRTIGGECARLLSLGTGHGLEDLVIRHALGASPDIVPTDEAAGVLMIPIPQAGVLRRIEGLRQARAVPGIEEILVSIRDGYELVPLPEGGSYLGFMFARGPDAEGVESALRTAHAALRIVTGPLMRIEDRRPG